MFGGGILLEVSGYEANVERASDAIDMMRSLFAGIPVVVHIVVIALLLNFSLNQREHAVIRAEIDRRNSPVEG